MGGKKIWAYALNSSNEYIKKADGTGLRLFSIWEALKLKKEDPFTFDKITFMSTQNNVEHRSKLTPVKSGFFRYIDNQKGNSHSGDGESLSHAFAISAISKLHVLNFVIQNQSLTIKPVKMETNDLKVRFSNGNFYYPDIICTFNSPKALIEKWGNKIAIEIAVSHFCENKKIRDFEDHNYPIIEITLNQNMQLLKEASTPEQLEYYHNFLIKKFNDRIYGKVVSNPIRAPFHRKQIKLERKNFENQLNKKNQEINHLQSNIEEQYNHLNNKNKIIDRLNLDIFVQKNEIEQLKNKSFLQKLRELFINRS